MTVSQFMVRVAAGWLILIAAIAIVALSDPYSITTSIIDHQKVEICDSVNLNLWNTVVFGFQTLSF